MVNKSVEVNNEYSVSRSDSQYICTFHAISNEKNGEYEAKGEVVRAFPCLLSMHEVLTNEGHCGNELMIAVNYLLAYEVMTEAVLYIHQALLLKTAT